MKAHAVRIALAAAALVAPQAAHASLNHSETLLSDW
jgi:hypothetical protein